MTNAFWQTRRGRSYLTARTLDQVFPLLSSQSQTPCMPLGKLPSLPPSVLQPLQHKSIPPPPAQEPLLCPACSNCSPSAACACCTRPTVNTRPVSKHISFSVFVEMNLVLQIPLVRFQPTHLKNKNKSRPANWVSSRHPWLNEPKQISTVQYSFFFFFFLNLNSPSTLYFKQHDLPFWGTIRTKAKFLHVPLLF